MPIWTLLILFCLSAEAKNLSLHEIFDAAKQNVESIKQQQAQVDLSKSQLKQAASSFYPNLNFLFTYTRQETPSASSQSSTVSQAFTNSNQLLSKLSLSYSGLQGFREFAGYKSAIANIQAQEASLLLSEINLYTQVAQNYYSVLSAKQDFKDLEVLQKSAQKRVVDIERFVTLGRSKKADLLSQQAQAALLFAQAHQAQELFKLHQNTLRTMTGMKHDDDASDNNTDLPSTLEPIELVLQSVQNRPDIKSLEAQVTAAEQNVKVLQAGHLPSLGLTANYYPYRTGVLQTTHWDVGVSVTVPLFQGFGVNAQVEQAKATARALRYASLQAVRDAEKQIRLNYDTLKSAIETVPLLKKAKDIAKANYDQQVDDYKHKLNTNLDVNTALTQLATITRTYNQTWYQGKAALQALNASRGQLP